MAAVKFVAASRAVFNGLVTKDPNTLYFIKDEHKLYKGEECFSGGVYTTVTEDPAAAELNTLYLNTTDGSVKYYDGTRLVTLVKPQPAAITGAGSVNELTTSKAVVDYVAAKIGEVNAENEALTDRVTKVEQKATDNATAIDTINGTGDGSISKALSDAKEYTDAAKGALEAEVGKKADKATTLEGYGITDAYTKAAVDSAIADAVANAHHLKREIVAELPEVAQANEDTIYMVPKAAGAAGSTEGNAYLEYMLINGKFEQIGDSTVDLTDYATKAYADGKADDALAAAKADTAAKIAALDKADAAVTNQYVTSVSQADGVISVTRTTLPVYSVAAGKTDGTIAVNGTDVKVTGLGSAAFADTTAFDAKGSAAAAQAAAAEDAQAKADAAKDAAIAKAAEDAKAQAAAAQTAAIQAAAADATAKADKAKSDAVDTAAADATSKANQAKADAIAASNAYTDTQVAAAKTAAAEDAQAKADAALNSAKTYVDEQMEWSDLG